MFTLSGRNLLLTKLHLFQIKPKKKISHVNMLRSCKYFLPIQTRWSDNDQYGHVNNAVYYELMDTIINNYLIWYCGLKVNRPDSSEIGFMVKTKFKYNKPIQYPEIVLGGLNVQKVGRSSVHYQVHIFQAKENFCSEKGCGHNDLLKCDPFIKIGFRGQVLLETQPDLINHYQMLENDFFSKSGAVGEAVHVFVDPTSQKPIAMSSKIKNGLLNLVSNSISSNKL